MPGVSVNIYFELLRILKDMKNKNISSFKLRYRYKVYVYIAEHCYRLLRNIYAINVHSALQIQNKLLWTQTLNFSPDPEVDSSEN